MLVFVLDSYYAHGRTSVSVSVFAFVSVHLRLHLLVFASVFAYSHRRHLNAHLVFALEFVRTYRFAYSCLHWNSRMDSGEDALQGAVVLGRVYVSHVGDVCTYCYHRTCC